MNADREKIALVFCIVFMAGMSFAAPVLQLGNAVLVPDGSVTLPFIITGADAPYAGINARIVLPSKVHCTGVTHGSALDTNVTIAYTVAADDPETVTVVAYSRDIIFGDGEILLFTITADSDIPAGEYPVAFDARKADVIINSKWALATGTESVTGITVQNGIITVAETFEGEPAEGEAPPPTPEEVAEYLLAQFDTADTDGDGFLSFEEALAAFPGLTRELFDLLDANGDGKLSREELEAFLADKRCGCCRRSCNSTDDAKRYLGDWLLIGLTLIVLLGLAGMQKRS